MKVLFVTSSTTTTGGGSKSFLQMLDGLLTYGIDPLVILPDNKGLYTLLKNKRIACQVLHFKYRMSVYPWKNNSHFNFLLFIPRLLGRFLINNLATIQLIYITKKLRPDIIHTNVSVTAIGYYVARLLNIPHIWHIREYGPRDFNYIYYPSFSNQRRRYNVDKSYTICITKDIQKYNYLCNNPNCRVIYNGILSKQCTIKASSLEKNFFLYAGRIEAAKGILDLIDAYAIYHKNHHSPLPLYVAGKGTPQYTSLVKQRITQHCLQDYIILLGESEDMYSLYSSAKALIVPSISEGFGRITAEAMFSSCLVIGNDTAGTKEQFNNGKELTNAEIALRYTTQQQLIKHMLDVTNTPIESYQDMINTARRTVLELYTTEVNAEQVYEFYKQILNI